MTPQIKLKLDDGFYGCFKMDSGHPLVVPLISLSADTALFALSKKESGTFKTGDRVRFQQILGAAQIDFKDQILGKIKWIKSLNRAPYLAVACRFLAVTDTVHQQLVRFIETERQTRGQYG